MKIFYFMFDFNNKKKKKIVIIISSSEIEVFTEKLYYNDTPKQVENAYSTKRKKTTRTHNKITH